MQLDSACFLSVFANTVMNACMLICRIWMLLIIEIHMHYRERLQCIVN